MRAIRSTRRFVETAALAAALCLLLAGKSSAAGPELALRVTAPDTVTAGQLAKIQIVATNVGDQPLAGDVTVANTFPVGMTPVPADFTPLPPSAGTCSIVDQTTTCVLNAEGLLPGAQVRFGFASPVDPGASGTLVNSVEVSGGGTTGSVTGQQSMTVGPPDPFGVRTFLVIAREADGSPAVRAGSTPAEITTVIGVPTKAQALGGVFPVVAAVEHFKDVTVHVPPGLVGRPASVPRCTTEQLAQMSPVGHAEIPQCPQDSQVGTVTILGGDVVPLYNLVPPIGAPAAFGFEYQSSTVVLVAKLRPSDSGIDIVARTTSTSVALPSVDVTLWGVPADSSHDNLRHLCLDGYAGNNGNVCPTDAPSTAFLRMPTSCDGNPLTWGLDMNSYVDPDTFVHASATTPALIGCALNPFNPSFTLVPSDQVPHVATGLDVNVSLPQDVNPSGLAQADLRTATVTLPAGMTINPSSADGLKACTDVELRLGLEGPSTCPDGSKIGTVTLSTPLLDHEIGGSILLRSQNSSDPMSGELFRIAVEIRSDDDGIDIKLPAAIRADPNTGQITTTFDDLPQLPFSSLKMHFKTGPRAPLVSPRTCGTQTANVHLVAWSGAVVDTHADFSLSGDGKGAACAAETFTPKFRAGSENPVAGTSTPFNLSLSREDRDQLFQALTVKMPTGLLGHIKNAEQCPSAAADAGACQSGSQIGSATVGAGVGPNPFFITDGKVFLTGAHKGAPYGLAIVVRALAGPFDLGSVVVRAAIHVNPKTAALSVVSDRFPTVVKGVPLNLRAVRLSINKPNFMVTPTSCAAKRVSGTATSTAGAVANLSTRFQVGNCGDLRFAPRIRMTVGSRGRTSIRRSTPLTTTITQARGQANLKSVKVTLPETLAALLPVVNDACTLAQYQANDCGKARAGSAVAVTPLLKNPLRGGAFFVRHPGRPLPDLMIALRGDVSLDLVGRVTIPGGKRLATNFDTLPDAPITRFKLKIVAGRNGPIGVVSNLCSTKGKTTPVAVSMRGQNGASIDRQQRLRVKGCGGKDKRR